MHCSHKKPPLQITARYSPLTSPSIEISGLWPPRYDYFNIAMTDTHPQQNITKSVAVAFCTDKYMEAPLHVAASSLLRHLDPAYQLRLYFLLTGFSQRDINHLRSTLALAGRPHSIKILDSSPSRIFAQFPGLHGRQSVYHRLLLPELVNEDRLLYLDSDTCINTDVAPLFNLDMAGKPAGFIVDGTVRYALDNTFQTLIGRSIEAPAFNSGVCLFNMPEWRHQNCTVRLMALAAKYQQQLISHDQSLLNALFADDCFHIDPKFNLKIYPSNVKKEIPSDCIFHFVGSPKPWDIGARLILPQARIWYRALRQTALPFTKRVSWFNLNSWLRFPKIASGYLRALRTK
jgi:lipopolysaccharide biosynthesis glycosyltransferase